MIVVSYIPWTRSWRSRREGVLCMKTVERIHEIVDGEIGGSRAAHILERHLEACRSCQLEAHVIRDLKVAITRVGSDADPQIVARLQDLAQRLCQGTQPHTD